MAYFKVKSINLLNSPAYLGHNDEVYLELCNKKGDVARPLMNFKWGFSSIDGGTKKSSETSELIANQTMNPTRFILRYQ